MYKKYLGSYNWDNQIFVEFKNILAQNFTTIESTFFHFCKVYNEESKLVPDDSSSFSFTEFAEGLSALVPNRFSKQEISLLWGKVTRKNSEVSYARFKDLLESVFAAAKTMRSNR